MGPGQAHVARRATDRGSAPGEESQHGHLADDRAVRQVADEVSYWFRGFPREGPLREHDLQEPSKKGQRGTSGCLG